MKKLSLESKLDVAEKFAGKLYCFVNVCSEHGEGGALGVAVANESGYWPIPVFFANGTYSEMEEHADELNLELGYKPRFALDIIMSSMAAGSVSA